MSFAVYAGICVGAALLVQSGKELADGDARLALPRFTLAVLAGAIAVTAAAFAVRRQFAGARGIMAKRRIQRAFASSPLAAHPLAFMGGTFALTLAWTVATHVAEDPAMLQRSDLVSCILISLAMVLLGALLSSVVRHLIDEVAAFIAVALAPLCRCVDQITAACSETTLVASPYFVWPPALFNRPPPLQP